MAKKKVEPSVQPKEIREEIYDYGAWPTDYCGDGLGEFRGDVDELIVRLRALRDKYPKYDRIEINLVNIAGYDREAPRYSVSFTGIRKETPAELETRKYKLQQERDRAAKKAAKSRATQEARERRKLEELKAKYEKEK